MDANGLYVRINDTELEMLGYPREELIGQKKFSDLLTPKSQKTFQVNFPRFKQQGWIRDLQFEMVRKDGTIVPVSLCSTVVKDKAGNFLMSRSVVLDITYRRKAEQERERFLGVGSDLQIITGSDGYYHWVSPSFEQTLGWHPDEMTSCPWSEFVHPDDLQSSLAEATNLLSGSETFAFENRMRHKDGSYRWLLWKAQCYPEEQLIYAAAVDISDRRQTELQLQRTEDRLRYLLSASPAVLYACKATGDYAATFIGENVSAMLGHESREFLEDSQFWASHIHPEDAPQVFAGLEHLFETNTHTHEYRFLHRDGTYRWVRDELKLIRDRTGNPIEIVGYWIDITERIQSEDKIREQANLLNIATDAIFVHDLDNHILFWNQGAERLYGWSAAEMLGQDWQHLLSQESQAEMGLILQMVLEQGMWQGELKKITQADDSVFIMSRCSLMRDDAGQPKSILVVDTDITEKKQLEAQFLRTQRLESLGTMASGIAHDLNNILTPIIGIVQLLPLRIANLDDQTQRLLTVLDESSKRGSDLVKQILSFTRGIDGKSSNTQVSHLLREVYKIIQQTFPKSIELSTEIPKDLWLLPADATLLHQVFMNLCINARDAMPNGGTLSISAENIVIDENYARMHIDAQTGFYVAVTIADTGTGIPSKVLDHIFDPFFTTKEVGKGTGLGLSTVLGIVKSHRGFINVYSELGKGTRFKIYLPATKSSEIDQTIETNFPFGKGELILVVDDETAIQEITKTTLETHGYIAMTASDGIEAIALYAEHKHAIRVVLLDLMMPELDSVTIVRTLKKFNPKVQIVAMSGLATSEAATQVMKEGAKAFLAKPFTVPELLNLLPQLCDNTQ